MIPLSYRLLESLKLSREIMIIMLTAMCSVTSEKMSKFKAEWINI